MHSTTWRLRASPKRYWCFDYNQVSIWLYKKNDVVTIRVSRQLDPAPSTNSGKDFSLGWYTHGSSFTCHQPNASKWKNNLLCSVCFILVIHFNFWALTVLRYSGIPVIYGSPHHQPREEDQHPAMVHHENRWYRRHLFLVLERGNMKIDLLNAS